MLCPVRCALSQDWNRVDFFEKIASSYDTILDLLSIGLYRRFLRKAVEILAPGKGERILDICSGTGRVASWMAQAVGSGGEIVGMDMAAGMVEVAKSRYGGLTNTLFLQKDVTEPWGYQNYFDGIFASFSLHEIGETERPRVIQQSFMALKEKGRMVIADFNPQLSGIRRILLLIFFKLFERENLDFLSLKLEEILERAGFRRIQTFPVLSGLFLITIVYRNQN
ncbi:MAG: class I SAM-dependent methyltransferase [Syntrophaceae bacterium]|nr:class I SAM-dependent methyltransferase [Syntrophaceae bacterium]